MYLIKSLTFPPLYSSLDDITLNKHYASFQDNTIIVDTPGIGGSGLVTEKLMEYLPNALSFIFVINVGSAGGMQKDRVITLLHLERL